MFVFQHDTRGVTPFSYRTLENCLMWSEMCKSSQPRKNESHCGDTFSEGKSYEWQNLKHDSSNLQVYAEFIEIGRIYFPGNITASKSEHMNTM